MSERPVRLGKTAPAPEPSEESRDGWEAAEIVALIHEGAMYRRSWAPALDRARILFGAVGALVASFEPNGLFRQVFEISGDVSNAGDHKHEPSPGAALPRNRRMESFMRNAVAQTPAGGTLIEDVGEQSVLYIAHCTRDQQFEQTSGSCYLFSGPVRGSFRDRALRLAKFLSPHLVKRALAYRHYSQEEGASQILQTVFRSLRTPAFVSNDRGDVYYWNGAAQKIFETNAVLGMSERKLVIHGAANQTLFAEMIAQAHQTASGPLSIFLHSSNEEQDALLSVTATPIAPPLDQNLYFNQGRLMSLVTMRCMDETAPVDSACLKSLGLTTAEAEVAHAFALGMTAEEIAAERGSTPQTVRYQLKQVYAKTGIKRKGGLILLLEHMRPITTGGAD